MCCCCCCCRWVQLWVSHEWMNDCYAPAPNRRGIKRLLLSESVCLSRTSGPPNSKTERPRKTKIGTEVAHVTCDSDTTGLKGQMSRSSGRFTHRGLNAWGRCSGDRENVLGVGNYCYVASARRRARRWGAHWGRRGAGHIVSPRAQHLCMCVVYYWLCIDRSTRLLGEEVRTHNSTSPWTTLAKSTGENPVSAVCSDASLPT